MESAAVPLEKPCDVPLILKDHACSLRRRKTLYPATLRVSQITTSASDFFVAHGKQAELLTTSGTHSKYMDKDVELAWKDIIHSSHSRAVLLGKLWAHILPQSALLEICDHFYRSSSIFMNYKDDQQVPSKLICLCCISSGYVSCELLKELLTVSFVMPSSAHPLWLPMLGASDQHLASAFEKPERSPIISPVQCLRNFLHPKAGMVVEYTTNDWWKLGTLPKKPSMNSDRLKTWISWRWQQNDRIPEKRQLFFPISF